jgi:Inovirus Coat protein B
MKRNLQALAALAAVAMAGAANAAVDISAETTAAKTDIASAGGLIIGVVVAIAVIAWIRRVVK